jgi:outer membrane protein assembly factor BamB
MKKSFVTGLTLTLIVAGSALAAGWPKYCGNASMTGMPIGMSPISVATVPRMAIAWRTSLGGPIASAPSVLHNKLYIGDWSGTESAIDVRDGKILARADLGLTHAPQCDPSTLGITSSAAIVNGHVYVAGGDDAFYSLDRDTLAIEWRHSLGDNSAAGGYYGWSSPAVVDNRILQGVASNCDNPFVPGRLVALDRDTGDEVSSADFTFGGAVGNGVWTSPAVDEQNRKIFITTASGVDYSDGLGFSIVRLNLDAMSPEDSWKVDIGEMMWDADWGSSPTLFEDRNGRMLVGAGHKDGHYYAFSRDNLSAGPVWSAVIARSGEVPQTGDGVLSTAAFDGARLYVGGGKPLDSDRAVNGSVVAIDPATGDILWRHAFPGPVIAPISTVNDVVFAAGGNVVAALDARTGETLWSSRTVASIFGGIAISGDAVFVGDLTGTLYAFRLFAAPADPVRQPPRLID